MTFEQYFDDSQHRFMSAVTETLILCGWEDDEAHQVAPDVLTDWEYADDDAQARLAVLEQKQKTVTADWKYVSTSDNPLDIAEARLLYTRSVDLARDINFLKK